MYYVALIISSALQIYVLVMWGRFILDIYRTMRPDWRPRGGALVLFSSVYALTDPPLRLIRKVVKPVRMGPVALDLAWTILLIVVIILINVAAGVGHL